MTNNKIGKAGAVVTGLSVLGFAISMLVGIFTPAMFASCLSSMIIAIGFVPFMASLYAVNTDETKKAVGLAGLLFAAIYAVLILLVYYAECTTIRLHPELSGETLSIISYGHLGSLFFNYDLLGYGFMGLSTFLISFTVVPRDRADRALRFLLRLHGIFFPTCFVFPMFPVFTPGTSALFGTVLLEVWCLYFLPVCVLGYRYFQKR